MVTTPQVNERFIATSKVRSVVAAMIRANNVETEKAVGEALRTLLGEAEQRTAALEARIAKLEQDRVSFRGVWKEGEVYKRGDLTAIPALGVYHANADTDSRPGTDSTWTLAVKSGRDGRDGTPAHKQNGAAPPEPRTTRSQR